MNTPSYPLGLQRPKSSRRSPSRSAARPISVHEVEDLQGGWREPAPREEFPEVLTAPQAARFLQIHVDTLYALCREGLVPHWRLGRALRFRKAALLERLGGEWLARGAEVRP